jgi:hypothetical protein
LYIMKEFRKIIVARSILQTRVATIPAFAPAGITLIFPLVILTGCGASRVSYDVKTLYSNPRFSPIALSSGDIAVLPLLTSRGPVKEGEFDASMIAGMLWRLRPDLSFVTHEEFESAFPPRFNRRWLAEFYDKVFIEEVHAVGSMDSLWSFVRQPYILVYALRDGAVIRNMDESLFKHVSVTCEIWSRDGRMVMWRSACKGVTDDMYVEDSKILAESIRLLAEAIPAAAPTTTGKPMPPGIDKQGGAGDR